MFTPPHIKLFYLYQLALSLLLCFLTHFLQSHNIFLWAEKSTSRVEWRQVVLSNFQSGEIRTGPGKITYWICSIKHVGSWRLTNAPPSPSTSHFIQICCSSLEITQTQSVLWDPFWDQTGIIGFYFPSLAKQNLILEAKITKINARDRMDGVVFQIPMFRHSAKLELRQKAFVEAQ